MSPRVGSLLVQRDTFLSAYRRFFSAALPGAPRTVCTALSGETHVSFATALCTISTTGDFSLTSSNEALLWLSAYAHLLVAEVLYVRPTKTLGVSGSSFYIFRVANILRMYAAQHFPLQKPPS